MKIAVLSGKGGTGKTLVAVNLAAVAVKSIYLDCDVEAPNGHLFFKPGQRTESEVKVKIPYVDDSKCNGCRKCVEFCNFNALAYIHNRLMVFEDICHSCGGCLLVCPEQAILEKDKAIGKIQIGFSESVEMKSGSLNIGESTGVPVIKTLLEMSGSREELTIIDGPPGSACTVMETIKDVDYCILVAEPTAFGVHNLEMVHELVRLFGKRFGVVLNKCTEGDNPSEKYCTDHNIKILSKIPIDETLGRLNSNGEIAVRVNGDYAKLFGELLKTVEMGGSK